VAEGEPGIQDDTDGNLTAEAGKIVEIVRQQTVVDAYDDRLAQFLSQRPLRVNIGIGRKGWVNVDTNPDADVECERVDALPFLKTGVVDELAAVHVLPRFMQRRLAWVLFEWRRVLAHNGTLVIECPDMEAACREFLNVADLRRFSGLYPTVWGIFGPQVNDLENWTTFVSGYTRSLLTYALGHTGFTDIEETQPITEKMRSFAVRARKP